MSNPNIPNKLYTDKKISEIKEKLQDYINVTSIPIVAEFAYLNKIPRQTLYELAEIKELMDELICKKESNLEKGALANKLNCGMAILS
ncbi:MAG: hypothetical protein ACP5N7_02035, partial [Candidatus Pacearchaeota archaeon]